MQSFSQEYLTQLQQACMSVINEKISNQMTIPESQRQALQNRASKICLRVLENVSKECDTSQAVEKTPIDNSLILRIEQLKKQIREAEMDVQYSREHVPSVVAEKTKETLQKQLDELSNENEHFATELRKEHDQEEVVYDTGKLQQTYETISCNLNQISSSFPHQMENVQSVLSTLENVVDK